MLDKLKQPISKKLTAVAIIFIFCGVSFIVYTAYAFYQVQNDTVSKQQKQINRLVSIENGFTESIRQSAKQETANQYENVLRRNDQKNDQILSDIDDLKAQINIINSQPIKIQPSISNASLVAQYLPKTVKLWCSIKGVEGLAQGSGSLLLSQGTIMTNRHVAGFIGNLCLVGITTSANQKPLVKYFAKVIDTRSDMDMATLRIDSLFNENTNSYSPLDNSTLNLQYIAEKDFCYSNQISVGDKVVIIGYPSIGGSTITATNGVISGFEGQYIKTDAKIEHGNSGGLAIHESGCVVGVPTLVQAGELESLGRIINLSITNKINEPQAETITAPPTYENNGGSSTNADTDNDGISDYDEINKWYTDPNNPDTDGDGFSDSSEIESGYNPNGPGKLN